MLSGPTLSVVCDTFTKHTLVKFESKNCTHGMVIKYDLQHLSGLLWTISNKFTTLNFESDECVFSQSVTHD